MDVDIHINVQIIYALSTSSSREVLRGLDTFGDVRPNEVCTFLTGFDKFFFSRVLVYKLISSDLEIHYIWTDCL